MHSKYNISEMTNQANDFGVKTELNCITALNFHKMEKIRCYKLHVDTYSKQQKLYSLLFLLNYDGKLKA